MTKWLVVAVCTLGLLGGCDDDPAAPGGGTGGVKGTGGAIAGTGGSGAGQGGSTPDAGNQDTSGAGGTVPGTGGTTPGDMDAAGDTGSEAGSEAGSDAPSSAPTSMMIPAATGGTLSAGGATLAVPGGVLSADKTLTLSVRAPAADEPGRANIIGDIYEFGPSGTTFSVPVALTLPLNTTVGAGKKVVVAWLEESSKQWFPVQSTASADKVVGMVTHFTRFALLQLNSDETCPFSGACGGSLDGTWKYTQGCLKTTEDKVTECGNAPPVMMRTEYNVGGTVTISGGRYTANQMISVVGTLLYSPACLAIIKDAMPNLTCKTLEDAWKKQNVQQGQPENPWVCAGTVTDGCSCQLKRELAVTAVGSYTVAGNKVTFTQDNKPAGSADDFCVEGNSLVVKTASGDVYTAVKQ